MEAIKEIKVTITKKDFETSSYFETTNCALAKALKRKFPKSSISVGGDNANIDNNNYSFSEYVETEIQRRCGKSNQKSLGVTLKLNEHI